MFSKRTDGGAKPRADGSSTVPATTEHQAKSPDGPRRAPPPPPRPGAAGAKVPRPGTKVKPRPLDALNVDLSSSRPPPNRSVVEDTADAVSQRFVEDPVLQEFETPMVREEGELDMREIARRKASELSEDSTLELEDKRQNKI